MGMMAIDLTPFGNGILHMNSRVRIGDLTVGTSVTFLVGEHDLEQGPQKVFSQKHWSGSPCGNCENDSTCGTGWIGINQPHPTQGWGNDSAFGSNHPGGAHFVFCDGAVKFISETIDSTPMIFDGQNIGTYQKLSKRDDGLVISGGSF
jgi:prepilin-type processing-associated H-X9-DG protein